MSSTATAVGVSPASFAFPPLYSFKPFFTVQPTDATWAKQRQVWCDLIRAYCAHYKLFRIALAGYSTGAVKNTTTNAPAAAAGGTSAAAAAATSSIARDAQLMRSLFRNDALDRQLSVDAIRALLDVLAADGWGIWADAQQQSSRSLFLLSPSHRLSELADLMWAHVERIGEQAGILTVYELQNGDSMKASIFLAMDEHLLLAVLRTLEAKGKCAMIQAPIIVEMGVKFLG